jgi:hypothetical protein
MILISLVSGILSGMWVWSEKASDIRLSINDMYMAALMTALMIFFMALLNSDYVWATGSFIAACIILWAIRTQQFVNARQYFQGMIPHHSMAILTSKRLLENDKSLRNDDVAFVKQIIRAQTDEIEWMKNRPLL